MDADQSQRHEDEKEPDARTSWRVDGAESMARLRSDAVAPGQGGIAGKIIYTDQHGERRPLPRDLSELTADEMGAAARALSMELGGVAPDYARIAAVERLTELRASGAMSEEDFAREKRRLLGGG